MSTENLGKQNAQFVWGGEFAELQQQISKQIRGYDDRMGLLEEMADAYICLKFLEYIFEVKPEELEKAVDVKLLREKRAQSK